MQIERARDLYSHKSVRLKHPAAHSPSEPTVLSCDQNQRIFLFGLTDYGAYQTERYQIIINLRTLDTK